MGRFKLGSIRGTVSWTGYVIMGGIEGLPMLPHPSKAKA